MCTTNDQYICGFYPAMNIKKMNTNVVCKHTISLEVRYHTYSVLTYTAVCFPTDLSESNQISYVLGV